MATRLSFRQDRSTRLLGRNSLNEMSLASPAVAGNSVFIRTATKLYRISNTAQ